MSAYAQRVYCSKCSKVIALHFDSEHLGPLYCLPCEPVVRAEREQFARDAAEYRARFANQSSSRETQK